MTDSKQPVRSDEECQRGQPRHRVVLRVTTASRSGLCDLDAQLLDMSLRGFRIRTNAALAIGDAISIDLPHRDGVEAEVVWANTPEFGCEFAYPLTTPELSRSRLKGDPLAFRSSESIGEQIVRLREARGWTRAELALRAGVSRPSIWGWENGKTQPRPSTLQRLSRTLGAPVGGVDTSDEVSVPEVEIARLVRQFVSSVEEARLQRLDLSVLLSISRTMIGDVLGIDPDCVKLTVTLKPD